MVSQKNSLIIIIASHEGFKRKFRNKTFSPLIARYQEELSGKEWLELELTELLTEDGKENIDFKIECFSLDLTKTLSFEQVGIETNGPYQPFLVSKQKKNLKRAKRQGDEQLPESGEDEEDLGPSPDESSDQARACEAVPIYYRFDDYGWNVWNHVLSYFLLQRSN